MVNLLHNFYKDNGFVNKIDFYNLENSKLLYSEMVDQTFFWSSVLATDNEIVFSNNEFTVFYSKKFEFYTVYFRSEHIDSDVQIIKNDLKNKLNKNNFIHFIVTSGLSTTDKQLMNFFEKENTNENLKYSICNVNSEIFHEDSGDIDLNNLNKISYIFSGGTISASKGKKSKFVETNPDKFVLDFKYPLTYFYFKFGFCYYQHGEQMLNVSNRENKVFLYSKNSGQHTVRFSKIQKALSTNKIFNKEYTKSDWFWYFANYNYYHMPFYNDYNICKFNIVMETQDPEQSNNHFLSEKTLKALMVSTPAYVLLASDVYKSLSEYGFYFVNSEFGSYENQYVNGMWEWDKNYENFLDFIKNSNEDEFNTLFETSFEKSKKNKVLLEKYIYSDKELEIKLLFDTF